MALPTPCHGAVRPGQDSRFTVDFEQRKLTLKAGR